MAVVASWDWINRKIYLAEADYDPIDIYREHRAIRETDESIRQYAPLVKAIGGLPKGGGDSFGNALQTLSGVSFSYLPGLPMAKIIPIDGSGINKLSGEVVTDNPDVDADPFDTSGLANPPRIQFAPNPVIKTVATGSGLDTQQQAQLLKIYQALMLDPNNPVRQQRLSETASKIEFDDVVINLLGPEDSDVTGTREP